MCLVQRNSCKKFNILFTWRESVGNFYINTKPILLVVRVYFQSTVVGRPFLLVPLSVHHNHRSAFYIDSTWSECCSIFRDFVAIFISYRSSVAATPAAGWRVIRPYNWLVKFIIFSIVIFLFFFFLL